MIDTIRWETKRKKISVDFWSLEPLIAKNWSYDLTVCCRFHFGYILQIQPEPEGEGDSDESEEDLNGFQSEEDLNEFQDSPDDQNPALEV